MRRLRFAGRFRSCRCCAVTVVSAQTDSHLRNWYVCTYGTDSIQLRDRQKMMFGHNAPSERPTHRQHPTTPSPRLFHTTIRTTTCHWTAIFAGRCGPNSTSTPTSGLIAQTACPLYFPFDVTGFATTDMSSSVTPTTRFTKFTLSAAHFSPSFPFVDGTNPTPFVSTHPRINSFPLTFVFSGNRPCRCTQQFPERTQVETSRDGSPFRREICRTNTP